MKFELTLKVLPYLVIAVVLDAGSQLFRKLERFCLKCASYTVRAYFPQTFFFTIYGHGGHLGF